MGNLYAIIAILGVLCVWVLVYSYIVSRDTDRIMGFILKINKELIDEYGLEIDGEKDEKENTNLRIM